MYDKNIMISGFINRLIYPKKWRNYNKSLNKVFNKRDYSKLDRKKTDLEKKILNKILININRKNDFLRLTDKFNEKISKNRRVRVSIFDILNEKSGIRFHNYSEGFRKKIDYRYSLIPIDYKNIIGIKYKNTINNVDKTYYCYNQKGICPFWRRNDSTSIVYCDAYTDCSEGDNNEVSGVKNLFHFKTYKNLEKEVPTFGPIALFDMVDCCGLKH